MTVRKLPDYNYQVLNWIGQWRYDIDYEKCYSWTRLADGEYVLKKGGRIKCDTFAGVEAGVGWPAGCFQGKVDTQVICTLIVPNHNKVWMQQTGENICLLIHPFSILHIQRNDMEAAFISEVMVLFGLIYCNLSRSQPWMFLNEKAWQ